MVFKLSHATADDSERIATIHLASFDDNTLLHAQFPTKDTLAGLHTFLRDEIQEVVQEGRRHDKAILVVRDTDTEGSPVVAFANWDLPESGKTHDHAHISWPTGVQRHLIEEYYEKVEAAKGRIIGPDRLCYRKTVFH